LVQHYFCLQAEGQIDLYCGDAPSAHVRLRARWPALQRSMLLRLQVIRIVAVEQRARCAVAAAMAVPASERGELLALADADIRRLARERVPWSVPLCGLVAACADAVRGTKKDAAQKLSDAVKGFEDAGMLLYAAVARRRLGELMGGSEGA